MRSLLWNTYFCYLTVYQIYEYMYGEREKTRGQVKLSVFFMGRVIAFSVCFNGDVK